MVFNEINALDYKIGCGDAYGGPMYRIQRLGGYTDGKPSWERHSKMVFLTKEKAQAEVAALTTKYPNSKFRLRKKPERR